MSDPSLQKLGEDLITTAARIVRWVPKSDDIVLSLAAARILARLNDSGPTRISDLATVERSSQPTITNHVKRLEALHLVERRIHPGDARAWIISLTAEGERELAAMRHELGVSLEPFLAALSRQDLAALREGVAVMHRLMTQPR
jgi:DNA-binding MarR family transcriptional regulator